MDNIELYEIVGGASVLSPTLINALARMASTTYDIGRALGSALRRLFTRKWC